MAVTTASRTINLPSSEQSRRTRNIQTVLKLSLIHI